MKSGLFILVVMLLLVTGSGGAFAGTVDIEPWSYPNGIAGEGLSLSLPSDVEKYVQFVYVTKNKCKKNCATVNHIAQDKRVEVIFNQEGDYFVSINYRGKEQLAENVFRGIALQYGYPVRVGKMYFMPRNRWDDANGIIYQTFLLIPQFGYQMPQHIDAEISLGDIKKTVSFNCLTVQSYGYCETNPIQLTGNEYNDILGDTYTCVKTADTQSCHIARYTW